MEDYTEFQEEEFSTTVNGRTILRILAQTKPHWPWVLGLLLSMTFVSVLDSYFTFLSKRIIDEGIVAGNREALLGIIRVYASLIIVQALGVFAFIYLTGILGELVRYDLRRKMFAHLQNLSLSYYNQTPVGWIISRVTSDSDRVAELVTWGLLDTTWGIMNIITASYFMLVINWRMALIVLAAIPVLLDASMPSARPMNVGAPAHTVGGRALAMDIGGPPMTEDGGMITPSPGSLCINRHDGYVYGLFLDWSARKVGLKELWTLPWYDEFDTAGRWTKAGGVKPEDWPHWMRKLKDY